MKKKTKTLPLHTGNRIYDRKVILQDEYMFVDKLDTPALQLQKIENWKLEKNKKKLK